MITEFRGKYAFLSNFCPSTIKFDGDDYPTVEHAYQAAKAVVQEQREYVRTAATAIEAKRRGRIIYIRQDWDDIKLSVMRFLVREKFHIHKWMADRLLETGDEELIEGNYWNDTFWGVCSGKGENHLGKILMEIRDELRRLGRTKDK